MIKSLVNSFRFKSIEFIKTDSELEKKVKILKQLHRDFPYDEKIAKDLRFSEIGLEGENKIEKCLKNSNVGMYVLHDVNLKADDCTAQIDWVVITPAKCYLIECKNLKGTLIIDENGQFIRKYELNGKMIEESIESPLSQSERHREILLKIREKYKSVFDRLFFDVKLFEDYHKTLVVLTNNSCILNKEKAPQKCKDLVIKLDELINYIKNDLENTKLIDTDSKKEIQNYAYWFKKNDCPKIIDYKRLYSPKCPECSGYLVRRRKRDYYGRHLVRSKRSDDFYGCSNYSNCKYTCGIKRS